MPKRVRLTWNRNQDLETEFYRVFRDVKADINERTSKEHLVMKVEHPKGINPVTVKNEPMIRETDRVYRLVHKNVLFEYKNQSFPFLIIIDGVENTGFVLDREEGKVIFDNPVQETSKVIAREYTFDGVQVWDYEIEEKGKIYYGPEAKDATGPNPPQNVTIGVDPDRNAIVVRWAEANVNGTILYYRIDAALDDQRYSKMSELQTAFLKEQLADRPYLVERTDDGRKWTEVAKVRTNEYFEYAIDRQAPPAIQKLTAETILVPSEGRAQVILRWAEAQDYPSGTSSMYRVRARNRIGVTSDPSEVVGPIMMRTDLSHILIRKKRWDGTLPSYAGNDAETIAVIEDMTTVEYREYVEDNVEFIYGFWLIDKAGNYSPISSIRVKVEDATAPDIPANVSAEQFHIVVG